ncbi:hypothetical protein SWVG_00006 [Synechococcus phage S-RIP1]|uniref:Uncharacterized protein n=1 Tax=Synechococcus phage S-RIP1 TaxID=754041 RepID=M4NJY2_9CAUD|nr:hypothetical protein SWVG_00006 [Synechococcus phage S-RIP1]AGG91247.1 hypothetical protein SWVG_00006 [Synechococcus phage S-RIP1]
MDEARFEEERLQAFEMARSGTYNDIVAQIQGEANLQATEQERRGLIDAAVAEGKIDQLTASQLKSMSSGTRLGLEQGRGVYMLTEVYERQLQKALTENPGMGADATAEFLTKFYRDFLRNEDNAVNGNLLINLKPELLRVGTDSVQKLHQSVQTKARAKEARDLADQRWDDGINLLDQNPTQFLDNAPTVFQTHSSDFGYKAALEQYESNYTKRKPNGEFMFTVEQLAQADLKSNGKGFAEEWPARHAEGLAARANADDQYRQAEIQRDKMAYQEAVLNYEKEFAENPTKAVAETGREMFIERYGKEPPIIAKQLASYTLEARAKAKQIEALESIPDGFIRQEDVDALSYLDLNAGRALAARFADQERKYKKGIFKDQSDSFKTVANGVTSFGSQKPNTPASVFLQQEMRAEYRRRVDQAVAGGADFNTAANTIAQQLSAEVTAGARDPNSKWYRKPSKPGGAADFPNLNTGAVSAIEQSKRNYKALVDAIAKDGMEKTLDTAGSIITAEEGAAILQNYGKPGFVIPTDVLAVAGMGNGTDPFTIINRQLRALNLIEIQPPQITNDVNAELSPELRKDLYNAIAGPQQKLRALRQGSSRTSGDVSPFRSAGSMRSGSPMRRTVGSRQENAFIQTIRTVEGTSGPDGYNTVYGGAVVPQLTQMTLGELYDAIKLGGTDAIPARLGGGKIPFKKDKYNSSASGALQLMPETLRGLVENSGYSWDDVFSPETQDRMMLDLARQGGVDIENMSPAQMEKAGNIWAGASPRYGQTTRTASDSYSIYQSLLQQ